MSENNTEINHYDFVKCRDLALSAPRNDKDYTEALTYFHANVFMCDGEMLYYYHHGELKRMKTEKFLTAKTMGFPKEFIKKIKETVVEYDEVLETKDYDIDIKNRKVNTLGRVYASTINKTPSKQSKEYVEFFLTYLKEIVSNGDDQFYQFMLKYCSCIVRLIKMDIILNLLTRTEGSGKTSLSQVLGALLGSDLYTPAKPQEFGDNNMRLYGKGLILLEETQGVKPTEHASLMDNLKNMITSNKWVYRELYANPKKLTNISNIQTTSNFDLNVNGRRAINKRISTKWTGQRDKWDKLYQFSDDNIKALYVYLLTVNVEGFKPQAEIEKLKQEDENSILKECENMNSVWVYIKEKYALLKKDGKIKQKELYESYCNEYTGTKKTLKLSQFDNLVLEFSSIKKRTADQNRTYYFIDGKGLFDEFKQRNYILPEELPHEEIIAEEKKRLTADELVKKMDENIKQMDDELEEYRPKPIKKDEKKIIKVKALKKVE